MVLELNETSNMTNARTMLLVVVIISVWLATGCRTQTSAPDQGVRPVRAMKVADFEGLSGRSFPGRASASQEVDLAFRVSGPLITLPVNVGDRVEVGDLVAR